MTENDRIESYNNPSHASLMKRLLSYSKECAEGMNFMSARAHDI